MNTEQQIPEAVAITLIENSAPINAKIVVTPTGLRIEGKLKRHEWQHALFTWKKFRDLGETGLADLIKYGNEEYGAEYVDETLELFDFDMADVLKAHAIGQLSLELREPALGSEHYYVLSKGLPGSKKEQGKWAALAKKHDLSPIELKRSIEKGEVIKQEQIERESGQNSGVPNIEGIAMLFQRWVKQAGGEEKILKQDEQWKHRFLDEIEPIRALAEKIEETLPPPKEEAAVPTDKSTGQPLTV